MPGVMIIEALAQAAGILAFITADVVPDESTRFFFVGIDKARFRKPVEPGDQLILTAKLDAPCAASGSSRPSRYVGDDEVTSRRDDGRSRNEQDVGKGAAGVSGIDPRAIVSPKAELAARRHGGSVHRHR